MAKVVYSNGIDYISGALNKVKSDGQHSHEKMLLATHRKAATTSSDCNRIYLRKPVVRTGTPSARELQIRTRFIEVAEMVRNRAQDLNRITQDQADFIAQKDLATGKKTMKAYLWLVCGQEYDQVHG